MKKKTNNCALVLRMLAGYLRHTVTELLKTTLLITHEWSENE